MSPFVRSTFTSRFLIEADAEEAAQDDEKVYEDGEMWTKGW